jgi:hypothetical protein
LSGRSRREKPPSDPQVGGQSDSYRPALFVLSRVARSRTIDKAKTAARAGQGDRETGPRPSEKLRRERHPSGSVAGEQLDSYLFGRRVRRDRVHRAVGARAASATSQIFPGTARRASRLSRRTARPGSPPGISHCAISSEGWRPSPGQSCDAPQRLAKSEFERKLRLLMVGTDLAALVAHEPLPRRARPGDPRAFRTARPRTPLRLAQAFC